jgi:ribosomal protein S18 acetylase RimI-like enzyme
MMEISYRQATLDDLPALALLRWETEIERHPERASEMTREEYSAAYAAETADEMARGHHQAWLAEVAGEPVACVLLVWWVAPPNPGARRRRRGYVSSVYTRPAFRRQGIARQLMTLLIESAREQHMDRLILWSSEMGRPLYESLGFVTSRGLELNMR